jgi:hypothetical protein
MGSQITSQVWLPYGLRRLAQTLGPASVPISHHEKDSMRRALRSTLPTLGSNYILITSRCSGRRYASIEIGAILKPRIGPTALPIQGCGAAERQGVGPPLRIAVLCCSSCFNASAPGSLVCATPSCLPMQAESCHAMLYRVCNVIAHAQSVGMPSCYARLCAQRRRACPPRLGAIASCPLVCATSSRMPIQLQRHRTMLSLWCNVVA